MTLFSQRNNLKPIRVEIQMDSLDEITRTQLWNIFYGNLFKKEIAQQKRETYSSQVINIWANFLHKPLNYLPRYGSDFLDELNILFFHQYWFLIFDFIEFMLKQKMNFELEKSLIEQTNHVLEKELCGYRIVNKQFVPITDENEINAIETAINSSKDGVRLHLSRSLELLSDRQNPDYRNSIKESISAVEALCVEITGDPKATLGQALKDSKLKEEFHGGILNGFSNLYGFTSNAEGIRHALMDEPTLKQEDALYMLVSCSAFVNYLRSKMNK